MNGSDFDARVRDIKARAHGRWTSILKTLGIPEGILSGKNQPCPLPGCGGTDRFQYTDKFGEGNYHCRACGAGGGLKLAHGVLGLRFGEVLDAVERQLCTLPPAATAAGSSPPSVRMKQLCERIWSQSIPVTKGDEVDRYLRNRGIVLSTFPEVLRLHPSLGYYEKSIGQQRSRKIAEYPAMIARVRGPDGQPVTLHRTYLDGGRKAMGGQSRKVLSAGIGGAAVRLDEAGDELAITEGIETGLAIRLGTGKPVWCALSCGNMEKLVIPARVRRVCVYGDNDANAEFAGQVSAYTLAQRLVREARRDGIARQVEVFVPRPAGADWADIWLARIGGHAMAA